MELSDFIKETIVQLTKGISDSQDVVRDLGGIASPPFNTEQKGDTITWAGNTLDGRQVYFIDFDVSITVSQENTDGAGGKLRVGIISVDGKKDSSSSSNATNKIKFRIPYSPPLDQVALEERDDKLQQRKEAARARPNRRSGNFLDGC